jgi:hypothetical protein
MKQRKREQAKKSPPKHSLSLPDLDQSRLAALTLTFSLSNRLLRGFSLLQVFMSRSY